MVAGRFSGAMIITPLSVTTVSPTLDNSQLPPSALAAMSTMTEPDFMPATAAAVTRSGGRRPGRGRCRRRHLLGRSGRGAGGGQQLVPGHEQQVAIAPGIHHDLTGLPEH